MDIIGKISDKLIILDCRPFLNALGNKFKGKGMERHKKYENITNIIFFKESLAKPITDISNTGKGADS